MRIFGCTVSLGLGRPGLGLALSRSGLGLGLVALALTLLQSHYHPWLCGDIIALKSVHVVNDLEITNHEEDLP